MDEVRLRLGLLKQVTSTLYITSSHIGEGEEDGISEGEKAVLISIPRLLWYSEDMVRGNSWQCLACSNLSLKSTCPWRRQREVV
jgi:hypothetical protein